MTQLIVDLNALAHNYHQLRKPLPQSTKMIGVVKANAYGFGAIEIAKQLITLGCEYLAVAYAEEGIELRSAGIEAPIMVFYPLRENTDRLVQYRLEPALYSTAFITAFKTTVEAHGLKDYPVHLKCNTGLNRIGLSGNEVNDFLDQLPLLPFQLCSVYSHLAASENEQPCTLTSKQIDQFKELQSRIKLKVEATPFFHLLNSSGCFNYPDAHFDAVRTGIALYGFANRNDWDQTLIPIASLSTPIVQTHTIKKGESVGYNQGWIAPKDSRIAVLPLGHADGIQRALGHEKGGVWIRNQWAPIVGNVCMDLLMVDISEVNCSIDDRAVIFDQVRPANVLAKKAGTISYELFTGLGQRIKRIYNR